MLKRLLSATMAMVMTMVFVLGTVDVVKVSATGLVVQTQIKNDTFEQYTGTSDVAPASAVSSAPSLYSTYYGSATSGATMFVKSTTDENSNATRALQLTHTAAISQSFNPIRKETWSADKDLVFPDYLTLDVKFKVPSGNTGTFGHDAISITNTNATNTDWEAVKILNGSLSLFGSESGRAITVSNVSLDTWHRVQIVIDTTVPASKKCAGVFLDGNLVRGTKNYALSDSKLGQLSTSAKAVKNYSQAYSNSTFAVWLDNIQVYQPQTLVLPIDVQSITPAKDKVVDADSSVVINFDDNVSASTLSNITVSKNGVNALCTAQLTSATQCTLTFPNGLENASAYKVTVPVTVASSQGGTMASEYTSYFSTYDKMYRGIKTLYKDDNFEDQTTLNVKPSPASATYPYRCSYIGDGPTLGHVWTVSGTDETSSTNNLLEVYSTASTNNQNVFPIRKAVFTGDPTPGNHLVFSTNFKIGDDNVDGYTDTQINYNTTPATTWKLFRVDNSNGANNLIFLYDDATKKVTQAITKGVWYNVTMELDTSDSGACKVVYATLNGAIVPGITNVTASLKQLSGGTGFLSLGIVDFAKVGGMRRMLYDNIIVYDPSDLSALSVTSVTPSTTDPAKVRVKFNNSIDATNISGITVTNGGNAVAKSVAVINSKTCEVTLAQPVDYSTTYSIAVPTNIADSYGQVLASQYTTTYTTMQKPFYVVVPTLTYANDTALSGALTAGQTIKESSLISNNTASPKTATMLLVAYKGAQLVGVVAASSTIQPGVNNVPMSISMLITQELAGCTVKAFIWDDLVNMHPQVLPVAYPQ